MSRPIDEANLVDLDEGGAELILHMKDDPPDRVLRFSLEQWVVIKLAGDFTSAAGRQLP